MAKPNQYRIFIVAHTPQGDVVNDQEGCTFTLKQISDIVQGELMAPSVWCTRDNTLIKSIPASFTFHVSKVQP
jgi:hypothetical protein